jgi:MFS family permease
MIEVLANRTYRHLFLTQVVALIGTGLATVALGLLAYDLAGANAGQVLGTALAIKMTAYVVVSPLAGAMLARFPRRPVLVTLALPWQMLAAVLAAAAGFALILDQIRLPVQSAFKIRGGVEAVS